MYLIMFGLFIVYTILAAQIQKYAAKQETDINEILSKIQKLKKVEKKFDELNDYQKASQDYFIEVITELDSKVRQIPDHGPLVKAIEDAVLYHHEVLKELSGGSLALNLKVDCLMVDFYNHLSGYYHLDKDKIPCKINQNLYQDLDVQVLEQSCIERAEKMGFKLKSIRPEGL